MQCWLWKKRDLVCGNQAITVSFHVLSTVGVDIMQLSQPSKILVCDPFGSPHSNHIWIGNTSLQQFFHTMRRQFTVAEWAHMAPPSSSPHQQLSNFYRLWVSSAYTYSSTLILHICVQSLKESFIKAEGSGLSYGLQNLEFVCGPGWPPPSDVSTIYRGEPHIITMNRSAAQGLSCTSEET